MPPLKNENFYDVTDKNILFLKWFTSHSRDSPIFDDDCEYANKRYGNCFGQTLWLYNILIDSKLIITDSLTLLYGHVKEKKDEHVALRLKLDDNYYFLDVSRNFWCIEDSNKKGSWKFASFKEESLTLIENVYRASSKYVFTCEEEIKSASDIKQKLIHSTRKSLSCHSILEELKSVYSNSELTVKSFLLANVKRSQ
ncbi:hypothetical protein MP638_002324 [Amoeboaphelidium occidentale]|nr:hypothetical protein MP638_002324 [Amoeboaphelidium occidentale]